MKSNRVRWSEVDREIYQDIVAVLIRRPDPTAQRIDGSGAESLNYSSVIPNRATDSCSSSDADQRC